MTNDQQFLQWLLPQLNLQWSGFRRVRRQAIKRITRRMQDLEVRSFEAYQSYIKKNPGELEALDRCCFITISRFWRDREVAGNEAIALFLMLSEILFSPKLPVSRNIGEIPPYGVGVPLVRPGKNLIR